MCLVDHAREEHHYDDESCDAICDLGDETLFQHQRYKLEDSESHVNIGQTHCEGGGRTESTEGTDKHEPYRRFLVVL